jgi:hypothetical protein
VWAFATASLFSDALFRAVVERVVRDIDGFKPQDVANTAWAFAKVGVRADALFAAVAEAVARRGMSEFKPQEMAITAWAFATEALPVEALFDSVVEAAARSNLRGFKPQDLGNLAWAFTTAGVRADALFAAIAEEVARRWTTFSNEHLCQIHLWQTWLSLEAKVHDGPSRLPPAVQQACREAMEATEGVPSNFQRYVTQHVTQLGLLPRVEVELREPHTSYLCDLGHTPSRIAIEVDGPTHFLHPLLVARVGGGGSKPVPSGATCLKRRLLKAAGWYLISVPDFEWEDLSGAERQDYLRSRLLVAQTLDGKLAPRPAPSPSLPPTATPSPRSAGKADDGWVVVSDTRRNTTVTRREEAHGVPPSPATESRSAMKRRMRAAATPRAHLAVTSSSDDAWPSPKGVVEMLDFAAAVDAKDGPCRSGQGKGRKTAMLATLREAPSAQYPVRGVLWAAKKVALVAWVVMAAAMCCLIQADVR